MHKMKKIFIFMLVLFVTITTAPINIAATNQDEFDELRERWVSFTTGGNDFDPNNSDYQSKLSTLSKTAQESWDAMIKDEKRNKIWPDYPLDLSETDKSKSSNHIQFTYQRIEPMATAYATRGTTLYHNSKLRDDIIGALDFMYANYFNENLPLESQGGKLPYGNWFGWVIGNPMALMATTMLMYNDLSPQQLNNYANASMAYRSFTGEGDNSANGIWRRKCDLYVGIATKNGELLNKVKSIYPIFLKYVTSGEGYYQDGTFIAHDKNFYNGGYGAGMFRDQIELLYYLAGSTWDLSSLDISNIYRFAYESYIPLFANGIFMDMTKGREITRAGGEYETGKELMSTLLRLGNITKNQGDRDKINGYLKKWLSYDKVNDYFNANANIFDITIKNELLKSDIASAKEEQMYKQYPVGDRAVFHSKAGFAAGLAMHSPRIYNYETGDSNVKGWHTSDGRIYLYTDDFDQHEDSTKATIDWQRLPGTTVAYGSTNANTTGQSDSFGGGVEYNGLYGTSAMRLHTNGQALTANKSYFMFDDEIVALGSGINDDSSRDVETIIQNMKLDKNNQFSINGIKQSTELKSDSFQDVSYLYTEGNTTSSNIGVYFPNTTNLEMIREKRTGKLSSLGSFNVGLDEELENEYLTLYQSHGKNIKDGQYAYVLLPNRSENKVKEYSSNAEIEILKQTNDTHAVLEKNLNMVGINHYSKVKDSIDAYGIKNYLSVNNIASLMVQESKNALSLAISDPTQTNQGQTEIIINRPATSILSADKNIEVVQLNPYVIVKVNLDGTKGATTNLQLSFEEPTSKPEKPVLGGEFLDNAIKLSFDQVKGCTNYTIKYGEQSNNYNESINLGLATTTQITNLVPGKKYYFVVEASNELGTTYSNEIAVIFGTTQNYKTISDSYDDLSKISETDSKWSFDLKTDGPSNDDARGKSSYLKRNTTGKQSLVYNVEDIIGFNLIAYQTGYEEPGTYKLTFAGSKDGQDWKEIKVETSSVPTSGKFYREELTAMNLDKYNYLKITIDGGARSWAPELDNLEIYYDKNSTPKATEINFNQETYTIIDQDIQLTYNYGPLNAANDELIWESSAPDIVTVAEGVVSKVSVGKAKISVYDKAHNLLGTCNIESKKANIALNKVATASTVYQDFKPSNALDGNSGTRWGTTKQTDINTPQWFMIDLKAKCQFDEIKLNWEASHGVKYTIEVSDSKEGPWTTIVTQNSGKGGIENYNFNAVEARYVRLKGTQSATVWGYSIYEFEIYGNQPETELESLSIRQDSVSLLTGDTTRLEVIYNPTDVTNKKVTWSSSDERIAKVDQQGLVTALQAGKTKIIVSQGDKHDDIEVEVVKTSSRPVFIEKIDFGFKELTVELGENYQTNAIITPTNASNNRLVYYSSDESIAKISTTGLITTSKTGETTITVENPITGLSSKFQLVVKKTIPLVDFSLNTSDRQMVIGEVFQIEAIVDPIDTTQKDFLYTTSDNSVVKIDKNGLLTVLGYGEAAITVTNLDTRLEKRFMVTVEKEIVLEPEKPINPQQLSKPDETISNDKKVITSDDLNILPIMIIGLVSLVIISALKKKSS